MRRSRWSLTLAALTALVMGGIVIPSSAASAQGVTSGAITGVVTDEAGAPIESAQIQVTNTSTGTQQGALTREGGRYSIAGLEPGGPYTVVIRRIGYAPITRENVRVPLGQAAQVNVTLAHQAAVLNAVTVTGTASNSVISPTHTGIGTTISDSAIRNLPTLNRNFTDFVAAVPQVSTNTGALSGGGVNIRQNGIQIDGASAQDMFGLGTTGQPGASAGAKSIPLESVKEYQVLLAPYDVRQGNFGGILINAVTQSGTNDFHGTAYGFTRNQSFTRKQDYLGDFSKQNYGFSLGGPIVRNHLFFFLNPEWQKESAPTSGVYAGSPDLTISQSSIDQFTSIHGPLPQLIVSAARPPGRGHGRSPLESAALAGPCAPTIPSPSSRSQT